MSSPFPGMDPYLERHWGDVHQRFITYACDQIQPRLPPDLRARMDERVFVDVPDLRRKPIYPDLRIVERVSAKKTLRSGAEPGIAAEALEIALPSDPITETFIEIRDSSRERRLITVIELLSPANKRPGEGRRLYLKKQNECRRGSINLVEIDLIRKGKRVLMVPDAIIPEPWRTTYQVCVYRASPDPKYQIYRVALRSPLPVIRVPLRPGDEDTLLDLQQVLAEAYLKGGYDDDIDYQRELAPPFDPEDAR